MKKINELTELEIFNLSDSDIELMIKLKKAEEGIKFIPKPKAPSLFEVKEQDMLVYSCSLLGDQLTFESVEEMNTVLNAIKETKSKFRIDYNYNKSDSSKKFATRELKQPYGSEWHTTTSQRVYSVELYNEVIDLLFQNKKLTDQFEKELKEYESLLNDAKWIEDEINEIVMEVKEKFWKLESFCKKMKFDYLPLANDNEEIAMAFMDKAYSLSQEQKEYVLLNYKTI